MALRKKTKKRITRKMIAKPKKGVKRTMAQNSSNESVVPYLGFGALFGYFLSKARATDYDTIVNMFLCRDFQLYGVILTAIAVVMLGLALMRKKNISTKSGAAFYDQVVEWNSHRLIGAFIFGSGWALAGTCPGTAMTQIGEGKVMAIFTVIGILAGVWAYQKYRPGSSKEEVC